MKKLLLFLTVFLVFGFLRAEEVQAGEYTIEDVTITLFEERRPEPEPELEKEPEPEPEPEPEDAGCGCGNSDKAYEKPKFFYIQPAFGFGIGLSFYRPTIALDADFLIGHTPKVNFYVGLDLDCRKPVVTLHEKWDPIVDFAVQSNGVVDIMIGGSDLKSFGIWTSLGLNITYIQRCHKDEGCEPAYFRYMPSWGTGFDFVFDNNIVLKVGIDGFLGIYPDLTLLVGYRF